MIPDLTSKGKIIPHGLDSNPNEILIKTPEQIEGIRQAGKITAEILDLVASAICAGMSTNEINSLVHSATLARNGVPAPLHYNGFPKSVCTSLNNVVCHGIPDGTILKDGDIINVDVTTIYGGYYGDASRMFMIGNVSDVAQNLVRVTKECLEIGIEQVQPGNHIGDIGFFVQKHAEENGLSVVRDYTGHGVGISFHEPPTILHYGRRGFGAVIKPNMVFTIEPMINSGKYATSLLRDGWTAVTKDSSLSAQWEHTIRVTEDGFEILTVL